MSTEHLSRRTVLQALAALAGASCGAISFDVSQAVPEQQVPGSALGGVLPSFLSVPIPLTFDLQSQTAKMGTGPATSAHLKSLTLTITPHDMPSGNFDFLSEVHISVGPSSSSSSLPVKEIANVAPVPRGQTTLDFNVVGGIDLLPYINAGAQLTATATGSQPSSTVTYDGEIVVTVSV